MSFDQPRVPVHERRADDVRARRHRHADRQIGVRGPVDGLVLDGLIRGATRRGRDGHHPQRLAVQRDHDVVRSLQSAHPVGVPALPQLDPQLVFCVDREVVADRRAAAGAEGQSLDVPGLVQVGRDDERVGHRRTHRRADREPADPPRRGQVALQPARVESAEADVVEAGAGVVGRQQRRDVDLQVQQIADRVAVLGGVEPAQRVAAAGIGVGGGGAVELRFQVRGKAGVGLRVGPRASRGRHHPRAELADDLLPGLGVASDPRDVDRVEREPRDAQAVVVAGDAVAVEQRARCSAGCRRLRRAGRQLL